MSNITFPNTLFFTTELVKMFTIYQYLIIVFLIFNYVKSRQRKGTTYAGTADFIGKRHKEGSERTEDDAARTGRKNGLTDGLLSGCLVAGIIFFMAASLQYGEASVVLPIAQMSFLLTALPSAFFLKEKLSVRTLWALGCGVIAIVFLSH